MQSSKRVFITGTSAGFGFDTAQALSAAGHTVFATMREASGKNAQQALALKTFAKDKPGKLTVIELDVTNQASVDKAVETAVASGGIDVLINNAGVGTMGIDEGFTVEQAQRLLDINLFGVMRVNRAVVPHFRKQGKGLVIYLSSGLGRLALPFMAIYTASKFAVEGYAESVSIELAPLGIQTVIVQPGAFGTSFTPNCVTPKTDLSNVYGPTTQMLQSFSKGFEERMKSGGVGNPKDVIQTLVEEVERTDGTRPLRRTVGRDVQEAVGAINQTCSQVQDHLLKAFGLR